MGSYPSFAANEQTGRHTQNSSRHVVSFFWCAFKIRGKIENSENYLGLNFYFDGNALTCVFRLVLKEKNKNTKIFFRFFSSCLLHFEYNMFWHGFLNSCQWKIIFAYYFEWYKCTWIFFNLLGLSFKLFKEWGVQSKFIKNSNLYG